MFLTVAHIGRSTVRPLGSLQRLGVLVSLWISFDASVVFAVRQSLLSHLTIQEVDFLESKIIMLMIKGAT